MDTFWAITFGLLSLTAHELGHYEAMRRCGVGIKEVGLLGFPISFLPSLRWKIRGVIWGIHPFLLGAFVETSSEGEIRSKPLRDQLYIMGSGPIANMVYALALFAISRVITGLESGDVRKSWIALAVFGGGGLLVWVARRYIALALPALAIPILFLVGYSLFSLSPTETIEAGGGGPVAAVTGLIGVNDFTEALNLAAILSVNLAVVNLLPLSFLDGGQIFGSILRRWFGDRSERVYKFVTAFFLFALVTYSLGLDVVRIWKWF